MLLTKLAPALLGMYSAASFPKLPSTEPKITGSTRKKSDEHDQGTRSTSNDPPKHRANKGNDRQIRRRAE